jgi:hypothetical protein
MTVHRYSVVVTVPVDVEFNGDGAARGECRIYSGTANSFKCFASDAQVQRCVTQAKGSQVVPHPLISIASHPTSP